MYTLQYIEFANGASIPLLLVYSLCNLHIRLIFGVASYFVVGTLWNKYRRGATGMEVIPNLAFWQDLPNLVKVTLE